MKSSESSWNLTTVVSRYISNKLKSLLSPYLENIAIDLLVSLKPEVALTDIMMREDALDKLSLPIKVSKQSRVSLLRISLPLTSYSSQSVSVELSKVRVFVVPNEGKWLGTTKNKEKLKKLAAWREEQKSELIETEQKGFLTKLQATVANNFRLSIRDMEIVYLDRVSLGYPCFLRIYINRLDVEPANANWQPMFMPNEKETYRLITVHDFSVAVVTDRAERGRRKEDSRAAEPELHDFYHLVTLSERHYLLKPCRVVIKHVLNHADKSQSVKVELAGLEVALNEVQMKFIKHCVQFFKFKRSYTSYHIGRPEVPIQTDRRAWWQYLVKSTKLDLKAHAKKEFQCEQQRGRYIDLYKRHQDIIHAPWLQSLKRTELEEIYKLEDVLPLRDILTYRTAALSLLRQEAASYAKRIANAEGTTNLSALWSHYMTDFKDSPATDPATQEELIESMAYSDRQASTVPTLTVEVSVSYFLFFLQKTNAPPAEKLQIYEKSLCECTGCREGAVELERPSMQQPLRPESPDRDSIEDSDEEVHSIHITMLPERRNLKEYHTSFDNVKEIEKITSDKIDPQLFDEQTIFVVHVDKLSGRVELFSSGLVRTDDSKPLRVGSVWLWDLASLCESSRVHSFLATYSLANLLNETIERNLGDAPLFAALRHFMQLNDSLSCLEFLIHYKDIVKNKSSSSEKPMSRCCNCGQFYSEDTLLETFFADEQSQMLIHMPQELRPVDVKGMQAVAQYIEENFKTNLLPSFLKRFSRWVFPSIVSLKLAESLLKKPEHKRSREDVVKSLIEVVFALYNDRRHKSSESEERAPPVSRLRVSVDSPGFTLTNTSITALLQWLQPPASAFTPFTKEPLVHSFLSQLRRMKDSLSSVAALCREAKKDPERQDKDLRELVQSHSDLSVDLDVSSIKLWLLDEKNISKYREVPLVLVDLEHLALRFATPVNAIRNDLRCYSHLLLEVSQVTVTALQQQLLNTSVKVSVLQCIHKHSLELPNVVVDAHIPEMAVELSLALLPLLSLLQGIDLPVKPDSAESFKDAEFSDGNLFRADFNKTKELLLSRDYPDSSVPFYIALKHLKYQTIAFFSLGSVTANKGLSVAVSQGVFRTPRLVIRVPVVIANFQEKCFSQTASVLVSKVVLEDMDDEMLEVEVTESRRSMFPVIPAVAFPVLSLLKSALAACESSDDPDLPDIHLQEVLIVRQHKLPEVPEDQSDSEPVRSRCERFSFAESDTKSLAMRKLTMRSQQVDFRPELDFVVVK